MPAIPIAAAHQTGSHLASALNVLIWLAVAAAVYAAAYSVSACRHPDRACRERGESGKHCRASEPGRTMPPVAPVPPGPATANPGRASPARALSASRKENHHHGRGNHHHHRREPDH